MQIVNAVPGIWVYTTLPAYNQTPAGTAAPFLTREQQGRAERIRQARLLFDGRHKQYFLDEQRSQFDFAPLRAGYRVIQPYVAYNLFGLISYKGADLLFGDAPILRVNDPYQQQALMDLVERSRLHQLFYAKAVDASYEGEAFIEACVHQDGQVYLQEIPADEIFPAGRVMPDGQYQRYDRFTVKNVGTDDKPIWLLLTTSYLPGRITRTLQQLGEDGRAWKALDLGQWPLEEGEDPLAPHTITGVSLNTVTWVPNQLVRGQVVSDYDGAIDLQDELNAKQTQIARVLAKHSDPKLVLPARMADDTGNARASDDVFFSDSADDKPEYITWNGELAAAVADRDFTRSALLTKVEMSAILLGIKEGAHAEAFKTVRVQAYNSITKAARKASYWKNGIRRCVGVAQDLEQTLPGVRYDRTPVAVELRDGLPVDDLDQANRQSILRSAGLISVRRALMEQLNDPEAVETEMDELEEEAKQKTPSIFLGGAGGTTLPGQEPTTEPPGEDEEKKGGGEEDPVKNPAELSEGVAA